MSFSYFPYSPDDAKSMKNPAIQLYGSRFFSDQTVSELLVEFLLVVFSPKRFGEAGIFKGALPPFDCIWSNSDKFEYAPKARLNLKLFRSLGHPGWIRATRLTVPITRRCFNSYGSVSILPMLETRTT